MISLLNIALFADIGRSKGAGKGSVPLIPAIPP